MGVFGSTAILVALNMFFRAGAAPIFSGLPNKISQGFLASFVGGVSAMVGIGGGTIGVPVLTAFNVPPHRAIGTSSAFGFLIAAPTVLTLLLTAVTPKDAPPGTFGFINVPAFLLIIPVTVLFAPIGANFGQRLNPTTLKKIFAAALFITGSRIMLEL